MKSSTAVRRSAYVTLKQSHTVFPLIEVQLVPRFTFLSAIAYNGKEAVLEVFALPTINSAQLAEVSEKASDGKHTF